MGSAEHPHDVVAAAACAGATAPPAFPSPGMVHRPRRLGFSLITATLLGWTYHDRTGAAA